MANTSRGRGAGLVFIPVALLLGLILGGMGPRRELEKARTEISWLKSQSARRGGTSLNMITDVVRIPAEGASRTPEKTKDSQGPAASDGNDEGLDPGADAGTTEPSETSPVENEPASEAPIGLAAQLDAAREAWAIRSDIAHNSFLSRTGIRENDAVQFDVVIEAMNLRLQAAFEDLAKTLAAGENLTTERGIRMVNDLTGVLALTYDELDRKLPPTWRAAAGNDFDLTDFIDPSVAQPLVPVEHKLEDRPRRRGRR